MISLVRLPNAKFRQPNKIDYGAQEIYVFRCRRMIVNVAEYITGKSFSTKLSSFTLTVY